MYLKKYLYYITGSFSHIILKIFSKVNFSLIKNFENSNVGSDYGINKSLKKNLIGRIFNILSNVESATNLNIHITLLENLLSIPKSSKGVIVECGTFKGATACTLSIAAKLMKKKLYVYDSYEGLPKSESLIKRSYPFLKLSGYYKKGMYKGSFEEVKKNIIKYGEIDNVVMIKGLFNQTLINHKEKIDFIFIDVDLTSSTYDCIKYLWPKLNKNRYFYTDDACDMTVVNCWFDTNWWSKNLNSKPPGYVGSGCGLPISGDYSSLGYSYKGNHSNFKNKVKWLY